MLELLRGFTPLGAQMTMVGGGSRSPLWLQIFADAYGMEVVKTSVDQEAAALGAAALGAVGCGVWKDFSRVDEAHQVRARLRPHEGNARLYRALRPAFEELRASQARLGERLHALGENQEANEEDRA